MLDYLSPEIYTVDFYFSFLSILRFLHIDLSISTVACLGLQHSWLCGGVEMIIDP